MPSAEYSRSAKAAIYSVGGLVIEAVMVVPAATGEEIHFDSRKSRVLEDGRPEPGR